MGTLSRKLSQVIILATVYSLSSVLFCRFFIFPLSFLLNRPFLLQIDLRFSSVRQNGYEVKLLFAGLYIADVSYLEFYFII